MESVCNENRCTESERMTRMEDKLEKIYETVVDVRVSQAKLETLKDDVEENRSSIRKVKKDVDAIKIDNEVMKRMATKREVYLSYVIALIGIFLSTLPHIITWVQKDEVTTRNLPSHGVPGANRTEGVGTH